MNSSLAEKIMKLNKEGAHEEEIERFLDQHYIRMTWKHGSGWV